MQTQQIVTATPKKNKSKDFVKTDVELNKEKVQNQKLLDQKDYIQANAQRRRIRMDEF